MRFIRQIHKHLSKDLLQGRWQEQSHPLEGHCYVAAEALYHLVGSKDYKAMCASYTDEGGKATHWWLQHRTTGKILDPTREQYGDETPPYHLGRATGFLTKQPSKRAQILLNRIKGDGKF